jgi:hypothetical protein
MNLAASARQCWVGRYRGVASHRAVRHRLAPFPNCPGNKELIRDCCRAMAATRFWSACGGRQTPADVDSRSSRGTIGEARARANNCKPSDASALDQRQTGDAGCSERAHLNRPCGALGRRGAAALKGWGVATPGVSPASGPSPTLIGERGSESWATRGTWSDRPVSVTRPACQPTKAGGGRVALT